MGQAIARPGHQHPDDAVKTLVACTSAQPALIRASFASSYVVYGPWRDAIARGGEPELDHRGCELAFALFPETMNAVHFQLALPLSSKADITTYQPVEGSAFGPGNV